MQVTDSASVVPFIVEANICYCKSARDGVNSIDDILGAVREIVSIELPIRDMNRLRDSHTLEYCISSM